MEEYVLTLSCKDRPGIVAGVTAAILSVGANILEAQQFDDRLRARFFMRVHFECSHSDLARTVRTAMEDLAATYALRGADERKRVLILASQSDHCLADLIYRWRSGELRIDPVGVVSNWKLETYRNVTLEGIPFHHLPVTTETRRIQEDEIRAIVERTGAEIVVLARYMQVLSDELARDLAGRCVNIHHGFLPGFKGARPYHQAHARGVKMIGATAHFVTPDLDEGPIIEQDVERVSHRDTPEDLMRRGRDIERRVLAKAVRALAEDRVLLNDATTVVFE